MRRALVLTSDGARHPFRRSLPPHVTHGVEPALPIASSDNDWKLFLLSFTAFFIAAYSFIF
jgi:hypothetical protein